jgi:hypothetical protein
MRTRLSPPDWANGVADPEALFALLDVFRERHDLRVIRRLHAKAYFADDRAGIVGSANLSDGGFGGQVELVVAFDGLEAAAALAAAEAACAGGRDMALDDLGEWIARNKPRIEEARRQVRDATEELAPAQRELDQLLGYGETGRPLVDPGMQALDDFIQWLRLHDDLPGAQAIIRRHDNADRLNLQGHVKQSFFAVRRFLDEHPELVEGLSAALGEIRGDIYAPTPELLQPWIAHVDNHAVDAGEGWSYSVLRTQTPEGLGGTVTGGGGNSSTLKRMFPLVARYLADR